MLRVFTDDRCLDHEVPLGFPETPARLSGIVAHLRGLGCEVVAGAPAEGLEELITAVHAPDYVSRFRRASARGVKIIFHSNSGASTDSLFPQAFLMNDWKKMLAEMPTCRIFVAPSENERLHSKTFVIDSQITIVGSYNMDPLSQNSNSEVVAVIDDINAIEGVLTR